MSWWTGNTPETLFIWTRAAELTAPYQQSWDHRLHPITLSSCGLPWEQAGHQTCDTPAQREYPAPFTQQREGGSEGVSGKRRIRCGNFGTPQIPPKQGNQQRNTDPLYHSCRVKHLHIQKPAHVLRAFDNDSRNLCEEPPIPRYDLEKWVVWNGSREKTRSDTAQCTHRFGR